MDTVEKILLETEMFILTQKSQTSQTLVAIDVSSYFLALLEILFLMLACIETEIRIPIQKCLCRTVDVVVLQ